MVKILVITDSAERWEPDIRDSIICDIDEVTENGHVMGNDMVQYCICAPGDYISVGLVSTYDAVTCIEDRVLTAEERRRVETYIKPFTIRSVKTQKVHDEYNRRIISGRVKTVNDVKDLVNAASRVQGSVRAYTGVGDTDVDAKSIMGVMSLDLSRIVTIILPEGATEDDVEGFDWFNIDKRIAAGAKKE